MLYDFPEIKHFKVHKMLFDIRNSESLKEKFLNDPNEIMKEYDLSGDEREVLLRGDPIEMYNFGIYPYLLHYYWTVVLGSGRRGESNLNLYRKKLGDRS
ncbi:MAG: hypothetical protein QXU18_10365 [Thermoplasmatales archaeon]